MTSIYSFCKYSWILSEKDLKVLKNWKKNSSHPNYHEIAKCALNYTQWNGD